MKLTSASGSSIELHIVGYEFASPKQPGNWDANWLNIEGKVADAAATWTFRDPCLTTWDARELLRWLRKAARVTPGSSIDFTEPNLAVRVAEVTRTQVGLVFSFLAESAPPGTPDDIRWNGGREVNILLTPDALKTAASEWELELKTFPAR